MMLAAARTSRRHKRITTNIAINPARAGFATAFVTLEITAKEMWERARLPVWRRLTPLWRGTADFALISESSLRRLAPPDMLPLQIFYRPSMRLRPLRLECRRLAREMNSTLKLEIVDYLGLMRGDHHERERWRVLQEAVFALKAIAGELGIPMLLLSQLNRETNENLRDTRAAEQHASNILFLWQKPTGSDNSPPYGDPEDTELIIGKQRNGPPLCAYR
jgi:replicative DNA helicase